MLQQISPKLQETAILKDRTKISRGGKKLVPRCPGVTTPGNGLELDDHNTQLYELSLGHNVFNGNILTNELTAYIN